MKVYIAQLKCPSNHCVLAAAGEYDTASEAETLAQEIQERLIAAVTFGVLKYECRLCKSTKLAVDLRATGFRSVVEAWSALKAEQAAQLASARMLKESRN